MRCLSCSLLASPRRSASLVGCACVLPAEPHSFARGASSFGVCFFWGGRGETTEANPSRRTNHMWMIIAREGAFVFSFFFLILPAVRASNCDWTERESRREVGGAFRRPRPSLVSVSRSLAVESQHACLTCERRIRIVSGQGAFLSDPFQFKKD